MGRFEDSQQAGPDGGVPGGSSLPASEPRGAGKTGLLGGQAFGRPALALGGAVFTVLVGLLAYGLAGSGRRAGGNPCQGLGLEAVSTGDLSGLRLTRMPEHAAGEGRAGWLVLPRSRPFLLSFWSATCEPCLEELPSLLDAAARTERVQVVLVNVDADLQAARDLWRKTPKLSPLASPSVLWAWDPEGRVAARLGTVKVPETYLVGPSGRARWKVVSSRDWMSLAARRCLAAGQW